MLSEITGAQEMRKSSRGRALDTNEQKIFTGNVKTQSMRMVIWHLRGGETSHVNKP